MSATDLARAVGAGSAPPVERARPLHRTCRARRRSLAAAAYRGVLGAA